MSRPLSFLLPFLFLLAAGCVPVAWVVPPTTMDFGAGGAQDFFPESSELGFVLPFSVGVYPLAFPEPHQNRSYDFGFGYRGVISLERAAIFHAPYLEASYLYRPAADGFWRSTRFGLSGRAHLYFGHPELFALPTAGARFFVEFAHHVDYDSIDCTIDSGAGWFCGYSRGYGERSFGFFLEAQRSLYLHTPYTGLFAGLMWRAPASMGAGFLGGFH